MDLINDLSPELLQALKSTQTDIPPIGMEYLTMTEIEKNSMSFNDADQQFVSQMMKQVADNIKGEQANSIAAQNMLIHLKLGMVSEGVQIFEKNKEAIKDVVNFDGRVSTLEKSNKKLTVAIILVIILIIMMIIFGPWYHNRYLTIFKGDEKAEIKWGEKLREDQKNNTGTTRSIEFHKRTDAEITKSQEEILKGIKPIKGTDK